MINVIGTDSEHDIADAIRPSYPSVVNLLCWRHFRENIERKLFELKIKEQQVRKMNITFFGKGDTTGLLGCDEDDYEPTLRLLKETLWKK